MARTFELRKMNHLQSLTPVNFGCFLEWSCSDYLLSVWCFLIVLSSCFSRFMTCPDGSLGFYAALFRYFGLILQFLIYFLCSVNLITRVCKVSCFNFLLLPCRNIVHATAEDTNTHHPIVSFLISHRMRFANPPFYRSHHVGQDTGFAAMQVVHIMTPTISVSRNFYSAL